MCQGMGVKTIRLGQLARGFGKVTRLAGIDDHDGQAHRGQRGNHGALVAPGRFEHNELRGNLLQSRDEGGDPCIIIGDRPTFSGGTHGDIELGFRYINTDKELRL